MQWQLEKAEGRFELSRFEPRLKDMDMVNMYICNVNNCKQHEIDLEDLVHRNSRPFSDCVANDPEWIDPRVSVLGETHDVLEAVGTPLD